MPRSMAAVLTLDRTPPGSESCTLSFSPDGPEAPEDEGDKGAIGVLGSFGILGADRGAANTPGERRRGGEIPTPAPAFALQRIG